MKPCPDCGDPVDYLCEDSSGHPIYECPNPSHRKRTLFRLDGNDLLQLSSKEIQQIEKSWRLPEHLSVACDAPSEPARTLSVDGKRMMTERLFERTLSSISEKLVPYFRATLHIDSRVIPHGTIRKKPRVLDPLCEWNIRSNTEVEWSDVEFFARVMGKSATQAKEEEIIYQTDNCSYKTVCRRLVPSEAFESLVLSTPSFSTRMKKPSTVKECIGAYIVSCGIEDKNPFEKLEKELSDVKWRWWMNWHFTRQVEEDWNIGANPPLYFVREFYFDSQRRPKRGCYTLGGKEEFTETFLAIDPLAQDVPSSSERREIAGLLSDNLPPDIGRIMIFEENLRRLRQEADNPISQTGDYGQDFLTEMQEKGLIVVLSDGLVVKAPGVPDYRIDEEVEDHEKVIQDAVGQWLDSIVR